MDRGAFWATVHGVTKSWARLKRLSTQHTWYEGICIQLEIELPISNFDLFWARDIWYILFF